ncbi:MAG: hypothetical protein ACI9IT_001991, partial [Glaciecola sp.]
FHWRLESHVLCRLKRDAYTTYIIFIVKLFYNSF